MKLFSYLQIHTVVLVFCPLIAIGKKVKNKQKNPLLFRVWILRKWKCFVCVTSIICMTYIDAKIMCVHVYVCVCVCMHACSSPHGQCWVSFLVALCLTFWDTVSHWTSDLPSFAIFGSCCLCVLQAGIIGTYRKTMKSSWLVHACKMISS